MGRDDMRSVFIGNLADSARNDDVTDFFKGYGKLTDISLKVNYSNSYVLSFSGFFTHVSCSIGLPSFSVVYQFNVCKTKSSFRQKLLQMSFYKVTFF